MQWTAEQIKILDHAARTAHPCYLRIKALAVWQCSQGKTELEAAQSVRTSRQSVSTWVRKFRCQGLSGLKNQKGRGRKSKLDHSDVFDYIYQTPHNFGVKRTRWTLALLAQHVPSLKGFSAEGVRKVLRRLNIGYKRGQPHFHSPDPEYLKKKSG
ncbi:MAG: helix-turn-helix domain-containing protein [Calditrichaeota bacterium]|nr:helix-turn-helix domain-containing protein [Calditrichota bacterium]